MKHASIISQMSLEDKVKLCSGSSFWETEKMEQYGIPSIFVCDGPNGLRKQNGDGDHLGLNASVHSTCFPTSSATACSFDEELLRQIGQAIAEEAAVLGSNVVLGPGANMKRNPLCGRNFEYYSEDPLLAGKMAAAWIRGAQQQGVGVSLKHFALNNQELKRLSTNALVDERALREYYLPAFETAVKESHPTTVMCAYNKVNGTYCSDNERLLSRILRDEWGFDGAVITDWGAMNDRIAAFRAGADLEMPGSKGCFDQEVLEAVRDGRLAEEFIDRSVDRILTLIDRVSHPMPVADADTMWERHHALARRAAAESAVLLKNEDGILPLKKETACVLIGELARTPRYQGTGSSQVMPPRISSLLDSLGAVPFAAGYTVEDRPSPELEQEALALAETADTVLLCIGLTDIFESEGYDRTHMRLPENQVALLEKLAEVNDRIVVVLCGGSAVEMPWEKYAKAILHMHLAGQAMGEAAVDLLYGAATPGGKLAETYPMVYADCVNAHVYGIEDKQTPYYESMYCGYRYFTSAKKAVRYPFGYGLSYTTFALEDAGLTGDGTELTCRVRVTNTGAYPGSETLQLYVAPRTGGVYRPERELKAFAKVFLQPGESKVAELRLSRRSFAVYDAGHRDWIVESGEYDLLLGVSSQDIRLRRTVSLAGETPRRSECSPWYYTLEGIPSRQDFVSVYGAFEDYVPKTKGTYDLTCSLMEMKETSPLCRQIFEGMERDIAAQFGGKVDYSNPQFKMLMDSAADNPMRCMPLFSPDAMPMAFAKYCVEMANDHPEQAMQYLAQIQKP